MPWCDTCSRFWNPPELAAGTECPSCRAVMETPRGKEPAVTPAIPGGQTNPPARVKGAPWHFKLLLAGVTFYMIYRIYWLIEWLPKHI